MAKRKSNIELVVEAIIDDLNRQELAEKFFASIQPCKLKKVTTRIYDFLDDFYHTFDCSYQDAINAALLAAKEAIESRKLKLKI